MDRDLPKSYDPLERSREIEIHSWLLIWSWGFLIPVGTLIWTHTNKYHDLQPYPYVHTFSAGLLGTVLAIAGFSYGIRWFSTFSRGDVSTFWMVHAVIGTIATSGMLFQIVLLAFMKRANVGEPSVQGRPF